MINDYFRRLQFPVASFQPNAPYQTHGLHPFFQSIRLRAGSLYGRVQSFYPATLRFNPWPRVETPSRRNDNVTRTDLFRAQQNFNQGVHSYNNGDLDKAISEYKQALNLFWNNYATEVHPDVAMCYRGIGEALCALEDFKEAEKYTGRALELYSCCENREYRHMAKCFNHLGMILCKNQDFERALIFYSYGLEMADKLDDKTLLAEGLNNIGVVLLLQGNLAEAKDYFETAANVYQNSLEGVETIEQASLFVNLGVTLLIESIGENKDNIKEINEYFLGALNIKSRFREVFKANQVGVSDQDLLSKLSEIEDVKSVKLSLEDKLTVKIKFYKDPGRPGIIKTVDLLQNMKI